MESYTWQGGYVARRKKNSGFLYKQVTLPDHVFSSSFPLYFSLFFLSLLCLFFFISSLLSFLSSFFSFFLYLFSLFSLSLSFLSTLNLSATRPTTPNRLAQVRSMTIATPVYRYRSNLRPVG